MTRSAQFIVSAATYADPATLTARQRTELMALRAAGVPHDAQIEATDEPLVQMPWKDENDLDEEPVFRAALPGEEPTHWQRMLAVTGLAPVPEPSVDGPEHAAAEAALDRLWWDDTVDRTGWSDDEWITEALDIVGDTGRAGAAALWPDHTAALVRYARATRAAAATPEA